MAYGDGDASFQAAGGKDGIRKLVDDFYGVMEKLPEARVIREMHPGDLSLSREKLTVFLTAWLGGPKEYSARFGKITIPSVHSHLDIQHEERDAWLKCMEIAIALQPFADDFKQYLLKELGVPAERVRVAVEKRKRGQE